ncbi:hypothetical protein LTR66_006998 [Elasticomyces elasticus]|nr:hypothetical protein LTR66_006998 [Elasticomyces elasticus]
MATLLKRGRRLLLRTSLPPQRFLHTDSKSVNNARKLEEETLPDYEPKDFYPVTIGEVFKRRYQTLGKLGYGGNSTVWLCRDLQENAYAALKVYTRAFAHSGPMHREFDIYDHLDQIKTSHPGAQLIRSRLDSFEVNGPHGRHNCIVHKPLQVDLASLQRDYPRRRYDAELLRVALIYTLHALDFLHTEANVIHTGLYPYHFITLSHVRLLTAFADIKASNIMLTINDDTILQDFEKAEMEKPSDRKVYPDRTIYTSRQFRRPTVYGLPTLCDFGEARFGPVQEPAVVQPEAYRAPEVVLEMPWSYSVDIWNIGVMIWNLFENKTLFQNDPGEKGMSNMYHLAQIQAYIGPPPVEFLQRSKLSHYCWDEEGNWVNRVASIPDFSLEQSEENLEGSDKKMFLEFVRSMLRWVPEERKTARELLLDPWLNGEVP